MDGAPRAGATTVHQQQIADADAIESNARNATSATPTAMCSVKATITWMGKARLWEIVLPHAASDFMSAEIKGAELDLGDRKLLRCWDGRGQGST